MQVTRSIAIDADLDQVWHALTDEQAVADWLDEPARRRLLAAEPGRRLVWEWLPPGGAGEQAGEQAGGPASEADRSTVVFELDTDPDGLTRVTVTEHRSAAPSCHLDDGVDAWDRRLLGLELRFLTRVPVTC